MRYDLAELLKTRSAIKVSPFADKYVGEVKGQKLYDVVSPLPDYRPPEDETRLTLDGTM